jgi:hypothetical protein
VLAEVDSRHHTRQQITRWYRAEKVGRDQRENGQRNLI